MDVQENCIQLKIDTIISDINQNREDNENEDKNQITALMGYSHCFDLFDFLQIYSKIQKNEMLFQTGVIYDSIGYTELSMDYINESLALIPNVPSIILYKSGLFASLNKLDEAQKWLLKYKYLIGENPYDNYIHDSFLVILYYLLEYEEYIILRKIDSIENKYSNYIKENVVLFFIKSKILENLAQKIKNSDKKRYISYIKESNEIKKKYFKNKKNESEILFEQGIKNEIATKSLILINPNILNYKPKKLIEYKNGFNKNGFSLFYTLIKICKILKLGIEAKKYIKIYNKKININDNDLNENNISTNKNLKNINDVLKKFWEDPSNTTKNANDLTTENDLKESEETIKRLYKSIWLKGFKNNCNITKNINQKDSKIIKTNFYINEGYYSHLNLKESILKNIELNNIYKNNKLELESFSDDIKDDDEKILILDKNNINKKIGSIENIETKNNNNNNEEIKIDKIEKIIIKKVNINTNSNKIRTKRIKNSLSYIIKKVITGNQKENKKNKRNKIINNDDKESKKSKKFCSTDNCNNQQIKINKKKFGLTKIESNSKLNNKKKEVIINEKNQKENEKLKIKKSNSNKKFNNKDIIDYNKENKENQENQAKEENQNKIKIFQNNNNSNTMLKNNNNNNNKYSGKNNKDNDIKILNSKNKLLTINESNKKMILINNIEQAKSLNKKNNNNNKIYGKKKKNIDTDYGKYKDIREINLVSYCLKQLTKKKENKVKKVKQKEIANLTDKIDLMIPKKIYDFEKQILHINEHKYIKSKIKNEKVINKSQKKQINTFTLEKKKGKSNQKTSDNNLISSNKSLYKNDKNGINPNMKNLKKNINNYGNKKELSKFKSLNYFNGNIYSNNNYLNINFNNYMNYNFNYSNRHDDRKNFDYRFNPNSDNKKREESYSKEKHNYRTINLDFKNMSTKLNNQIKNPLLNSFIDSKEKNKKSADNKYDFVYLPLNKIKHSPSGEINCLKKKIKTFKSNFINPKTKTSFSKYMLYNFGKKTDSLYFSKSINISEHNKYKNSSINISKNKKNRYNKTITNKSNSKITNK